MSEMEEFLQGLQSGELNTFITNSKENLRIVEVEVDDIFITLRTIPVSTFRKGLRTNLGRKIIDKRLIRRTMKTSDGKFIINFCLTEFGEYSYTFLKE